MRTDNGKAMKKLSQVMSGEYGRGEFLEEGHWSWAFAEWAGNQDGSGVPGWESSQKSKEWPVRKHRGLGEEWVTQYPLQKENGTGQRKKEAEKVEGEWEKSDRDQESLDKKVSQGPISYLQTNWVFNL